MTAVKGTKENCGAAAKLRSSHDLEEAKKKLAEVVSELENGELSLDESLKAFEGIEASAYPYSEASILLRNRWSAVG